MVGTTLMFFNLFLYLMTVGPAAELVLFDAGDLSRG